MNDERNERNKNIGGNLVFLIIIGYFCYKFFIGIPADAAENQIIINNYNIQKLAELQQTLNLPNLTLQKAKELFPQLFDYVSLGVIKLSDF